MEILIYFFLLITLVLLIFSTNIKSIVFIVIGAFLNVIFIIFVQQKYFLLPFFLIISAILTAAVYIFLVNSYHFKNSFQNRTMGVFLLPVGIFLLLIGIYIWKFYPTPVSAGSFFALDFFLKNGKLFVEWMVVLLFIFQSYILTVYRETNDKL